MLLQKTELKVFANLVLQTAVAENRLQGFFVKDFANLVLHPAVAENRLEDFILKDFANQVLQTGGRCHCTKILSSDGFYLTFTVVEIISLIVRFF